MKTDQLPVPGLESAADTSQAPSDVPSEGGIADHEPFHLGAANGIGRLNEGSLHAALKAWLWRPGDLTEVAVGGYVADLVRGPQLFEVQTGGFAGFRNKLSALLDEHPVQVVYPIAQDRWVVTLAADGETVLRRRRSPKHGCPLDVFTELVRIPELVAHPHLTLLIVLTREELVRCDDGRGSWRRKGISVVDRRLLEVVDTLAIADHAGCLALLPDDLTSPFTNRDLAAAARIPVRQAQMTTNALRRMGLLQVLGREGRQLLYGHTGAGA